MLMVVLELSPSSLLRWLVCPVVESGEWCQGVWPPPENVLRLILHADTASRAEPTFYCHFLPSLFFVFHYKEGNEK